MAATPPIHDNSNPLWAGPCGEGPLGGITQSMLSRFLSCRERFRLKYVLGLEPHDKWNHRIGYGNMWHVCEEFMAQGQAWDGALDSHTRDQLERYPMQREEIEKWWNVCRVQFPEYVKYWHAHPDVKNRTPLLQEVAFDVPYKLPSGRTVRLRGKWDSVDLITEETEGLVGRHRQTTEGIYLQENKTKGDIDKLQIERQLKFDLQTMVYLVALHWEKTNVWDCESHDAPPGQNRRIAGVRYNVVRRPLSGGKGSISPHKEKATKTKFTPAESEEAFYERLRRDYLEAEPEYWFFRVRAEISPRDIQVFRETCLDPLLETLCWWYDTITGEPYQRTADHLVRTMNYRTPFGVYSALEEGGATEYDAFLRDGSEAGLRRADKLFPELEETS